MLDITIIEEMKAKQNHKSITSHPLKSFLKKRGKNRYWQGSGETEIVGCYWWGYKMV